MRRCCRLNILPRRAILSFSCCRRTPIKVAELFMRAACSADAMMQHTVMDQAYTGSCTKITSQEEADDMLLAHSCKGGAV